MNRIDFSNLGGLPVTQNILAFLQQSYTDAFSGLAKLAGNKTILSGVESNGTNVTSGWISYNNELIPFVGGPLGAQVVITEANTSLTFQDGLDHPVYFTKTATCGAVGAFPFSDLVPLLSLQNIWRPGDIKERYCDMDYINNNFDADGYGINSEKGWRILSKALPGTAGKTFVNWDAADTDFNAIGKTGGEKKHALTKGEMPSYNLIATMKSVGGITNDSAGGGFGYRPDATDRNMNISSGGGNQPHNNMQPYFVILKLIKI